MFAYLLLSVVLGSITWIYLIKKPKNYPPGPRWFPIVGSYLQFRKLRKECGDTAVAFEKLTEQYKSNVIGLKLGMHKVVVVSSYPLIKSVLLDVNYMGRPETFFYQLRSMGKIRGITFTSGDVWLAQRNFVIKHLRNVGYGKKIMEEKIENEVQVIMKLIDYNPSQTDFKHLLSPSVLNVLWTLAAGTEITRDDPRIVKLLNILDKRIKAFDMSGGTLNYFPWLRFIAPEEIGYNLIQSVNLELKSLLMEIIMEHLATWNETKNDDVIYAYISEIKKHGGASTIFTYDQLLIICLDLFIGGATNTSSTLDFIFLAMVLFPDVQTKVQNILDKTFDINQPLKYNDKHKVPYVEAVIMEVIRYFPILPIIGPRTPEMDATLGGYAIAKDTTVFLNLNSVFNDASIFDEPDVFRPERFLDDNGNLVPNEAFIPFGIGKRRCLADNLAKNCIFVFFAEIIRHYKIHPSNGSTIKQEKMVPGMSRSPQKYSVHLVKRT